MHVHIAISINDRDLCGNGRWPSYQTFTTEVDVSETYAETVISAVTDAAAQVISRYRAEGAACQPDGIGP
jgi:hypothetical protein